MTPFISYGIQTESPKYRLWSTDWIKDPVTEGERLCSAIDEAIKNYGKAQTEQPDADAKSNPPLPVEEVYSQSSNNEESETVQDYGFVKYHEMNIPKAADQMSIPRIAEVIGKIVREQYPIHIQLVYKQVAPMYCNEKASSKVREGVDYIVKAYGKDKMWEKRGDYLWLPGAEQSTPRICEDGNAPRSLEYVAPEELCEAMRTIVVHSFGIEQDALYKVVAHEYGYRKVTAKMSDFLDTAYLEFLERYTPCDCEGKLSLKQ